VTIEVLEEDALTCRADVLVLKHAQALYGLDAQVVEAAGIASSSLPRPDGYRVCRAPRGVRVGALLFVGVKPMPEFTYSDVRRFGYKALSAVASAFPHTTNVALTLHGVGYGLDEVACFEAEVGGIIEALEARDYPRTLRSIVFLEINPGRAQRLRAQLESLLGTSGSVLPAGPDAAGHHPGAERLRSAGSDRDSRGYAFVALPFDPVFSDRFHYGIARAVHANGLLCERIDQQAFTGDILLRLKSQIAAATLVIADLTGANANVFLEVGFAWGHGVPTVLVCQKGEELKFDVQSQRCLFYESIRELEDTLGAEIGRLMPSLGADGVSRL